MEYVKIGFGTGLGFHLVSILMIIVGIIIITPGAYILYKQSKQPKHLRSTSLMIGGIILIVIGIIVGAPELFGLLAFGSADKVMELFSTSE